MTTRNSKREAHLLMGVGYSSMKQDIYGDAVHAWLCAVVSRGSQISNIEGLIKGLHYRGDGPWYRKINGGVITHEISRLCGVTMNVSQFVVGMNQVSEKGLVVAKTQRVSVFNHRNELILRPLINFVRFGPIERFLDYVEHEV